MKTVQIVLPAFIKHRFVDPVLEELTVHEDGTVTCEGRKAKTLEEMCRALKLKFEDLIAIARANDSVILCSRLGGKNDRDDLTVDEAREAHSDLGAEIYIEYVW